MTFKSAITMTIFLITLLSISASAQKTQTRERNCQCMPSGHCDGVINSDVQCHPSYIMVCCIRPPIETAPPFIPEVIRV